MIALELNGEFLKLEESVNIRFEKNFAILFQDLYQGDYSFPFTLNAEANYKYLGFANIPEASNKVLKYDINIYLFGLPFSKATLIITKATKYTFQANLSAGIKNLKTASKMLPEINFGDSSYLGKLPDEIAAKATVISQDTDYTHFGFTFVPHINEDFYGGNNPVWQNVLNMVNPNTGALYYNTIATGNKYALAPWFFLHFILQKIFDEEGLTPIGTFWEHPEMKKLLVYNNKSLDSLNEIGSTQVINQNYFEIFQSSFVTGGGGFPRTKTLLIKGPPNTFDEPQAFDNLTHEYTITQSGVYNFEFSGHVFLQAGSNLHFGVMFGTSWIGGISPIGVGQGEHFYSFNTSWVASAGHVGAKITLGFYYFPLPMPAPPQTNRWGYVTAGSTLNIKQSSYNNLNLYSRYVYPAKHMKSITVEEFLISVKQLGLEYSFDYTNNTVSIDFVTDKINNAVSVDWTSKAVDDYELDLDTYNKGYTVGYNFGEADQLNIDNFKQIDANNNIEDFMTLADLPAITIVGKTAFVKNLNQYYISSYDQYASPQYFWKKHTDYYYTTKYAGGETIVKLGFAPMLMGMGKNIAPSPNLTLETALMPASKNQGSSDMFDIGDNDFDLKFCFLRGQNIVGAAPNNKGGNYMVASTTKFGLNGHTIGDFDFSQHMDSGFNKRFIDWIYERIANGQVIDQDFRLNELDILTLGLTSKVAVDGVNYLLKTVSISASNKLKLSRAKMLKL